MSPAQTAIALITLGEMLWDASTWAVPAAQRIRAAIDLPQLDDLVLVVAVRREAKPLDRVGRLLRQEWERWPGPQDADDEPQGRTVWTIETLDGREVRWENVRILRLPEHDGWPIPSVDPLDPRLLRRGPLGRLPRP